ncbi:MULTISPECIES: cupin domain-containing protein [Cyanophyceae]|uniref:Cupin domain-containing protein n=1 Tax=Leptolyngbya subtilissima DQ-A4 TaxID=2933933 RepID=A0ABV0K5B0_9CYAN|nr:cupin domain-containing protein [Nodosilinea sp. FACHB-141]MBD2112815.1 cupin domain-containing protein [Nodosilinea sp. FACHB-141]
MTITLQRQRPIFLESDEGRAYQMLTHTITRKLTSVDTNGYYALAELTDTAGSGAPLHSHPWEETFYVLEGEFEMLIGNQQQICPAGSTAHVPAGAVHGFKILSPVGRALLLIAPASAEAFYLEVSDRVSDLTTDMETMQEICTKYGLELR